MNNFAKSRQLFTIFNKFVKIIKFSKRSRFVKRNKFINIVVKTLKFIKFKLFRFAF